MQERPNKVLLVTPHPDDAEGGCGGTIAQWISQGTDVIYILCTNGDKGSDDREMSPKRLAATREKEQAEAARVLGVEEVVFLRHPDGGLEDSLEFRGEVVREIRRHRPDVVMCMEPFRHWRHAHRDHRVSGQVAVDAVCTYAWRPLYFSEHIRKEGLTPHVVPTIYLWGSDEPDTFVDIGGAIGQKAETLGRHVSQMSDPQHIEERVKANARRVGERANLAYAEAFRVMHFVPDPLLVG